MPRLPGVWPHQVISGSILSWINPFHSGVAGPNTLCLPLSRQSKQVSCFPAGLNTSPHSLQRGNSFAISCLAAAAPQGWRWIEPVGQCSMQSAQPVQTNGWCDISKASAFSSAVIAWIGQIFAHNPQAIQDSSMDRTGKKSYSCGIPMPGLSRSSLARHFAFSIGRTPCSGHSTFCAVSTPVASNAPKKPRRSMRFTSR